MFVCLFATNLYLIFFFKSVVFFDDIATPSIFFYSRQFKSTQNTLHIPSHKSEHMEDMDSDNKGVHQPKT